MEVDNFHPPQENIEIYSMLFQIETALRELIIDVLSKLEGPRWYKKCLPGEILQKYQDGRKFERQVPWTQFVHHNPIYYVDVPRLKIVIERQDNWKKAFELIFSRKEILTGMLTEIEPIRNKIAHNRKATNTDVAIVRGVVSMLSTAIGESYFVSLSNRSTFASDIPDQLARLKREAEISWIDCREYKPLKILEVWISVSEIWWFDASYLNEEIDKIEEFFHLLVEYSHLPRSRGTGYLIESWVKRSNLDTKYAEAQIQLAAILANA